MRSVISAAFVCLVIAAPPRIGADALSAPAVNAQLNIELPAPGRLAWTVFDERSGLPQNTIVDLMTDRDGYVWAATQDGAARYDGRRWEAISFPREMGSNYPRVMRAAKDGGIWIGSFDGGLAYWRDGKWEKTIFNTPEHHPLPSNRIRGLLQITDTNGSALWIATDHGVARLQNGVITAFAEESGLPSLDTEGLCETSLPTGERALLVGTANGLARFDGKRFVPVAVPHQMLGNRIYDIVESRGLHGQNALWIASYGGGMGILENNSWTVLDKSSGLPSNVEVLTKSSAADGSPALWIGSEGGLIRFEHGRFTLYDERCGLPIRIIWKVLETTSPGGLKTVWLGTWGGGVVRLSQNTWRGFDATNGMPSGSVTSIFMTKDGTGGETIWAGTSDGNLARFDRDRFQTVTLPDELSHAIIFTLLETKDPEGGSSLWVGSFAGGLGRLKNGRWTIFGTDVLPNGRVYSVVETKSEDGTSVLWAGTEGGLARFEHGKWTSFRQGRQLPSDIVTQVLETKRKDGTRTLWVATSKGLALFESGHWTTIDKKAGLPNENVVSLELITGVDGVQWIWVGTFGGGACRLRLEDGPKGHWDTFGTTTAEALPSDMVQGIAQDHKRRIYLSTTRGVARLTPRTPTEDNPARFIVDLFTTEDGLPSSDCMQGARFVDEHGRVWIGTARGLAMYDPNQEIPDRLPKPLLIKTALLSNGKLLLREGDSLTHAERNLSFEFALLAYGGESRIRYRYQLIGFDAQPTEWTAISSKEYTNLAAGKYLFQVWGRDARGNISGPTDLAFRIRPAPWATFWAFGMYVLTVMSAGYGGVQWRVRVLSRRTKQLELAVAERTKELSEARDKLEQLASTDALTGVANRRTFDAILESEWKRAQRGSHWFSLVLLDVDFFKRYNDRYGHAQGDDCLRAVAKVLTQQCRRPTDLVARYGGEEFVLVLPETEPAGVRTLLAAILAAVDALQIEHADSDCAPHVTISLGAFSLKPPLDADSLSAVKSADQLLYQAKQGGRRQAMHEEYCGLSLRILPDPDAHFL